MSPSVSLRSLLLLSLCVWHLWLWGQQASPPGLTAGWAEDVLQLTDPDAITPQAYSQLLEEMGEMVLARDTASTFLPAGRPRQWLVFSSSRCLNMRDGYRQPTPQRQQAGQAYLGDPWHHSVRYRLQQGPHWQAGFNLDKDPGEAWRSQFPGFDSWHAYVRARQIPLGLHLKLHDAVLGHYRLRLGCGLAIHQGFSLGKLYAAQQVMSQPVSSIMPMTSVSEADHMQGFAADLRIGHHLSLLPYFSARQLDGTLQGPGILTALQSDGLHRTSTEASHRHAAWEVMVGTRLGWRGEWYDLGVHYGMTALQYTYRRPLTYYNAHYFRGHRLAHLTADYTVQAWGCRLRGEVAIDDGGNLASLHLLHRRLGDSYTATLLHRYYGSGYRQMHANAPSESSAMQGEQGVMLNVDGQLTSRIEVRGMVDWWRFAQPQYGVRQPGQQGIESMLRLSYTPSALLTRVSLSYRTKLKSETLRHGIDMVIDASPMSCLTLRAQLRTRIFTLQATPASDGWGGSFAAAWQGHLMHSQSLRVEGQAGYFSTDDYDSRICLTEHAILYGQAWPMLYGRGMRYCATATWSLGQHIHLDVKWTLTNYGDRTSISSGLQRIPGNNEHDLWLQCRTKF